MSQNKSAPKLLLLLVLILGGVYLYFHGGQEYLNFAYLKGQLATFEDHYKTAPLTTALIFFGVYVLATALSFPGAAILTLLGGAVFGPWIGLLLVSFASTIGAGLSFLVSRFLLRDYFLSKFRHQFETINTNIKKDGAVYLATLRLVPVFPFFIINLVMGLTAMSTWTYLWVSQLGMLPGTAVFVYAGREFSQLTTLKGILSPEILGVLLLLGILPLIGKSLVKVLKNRKAYKDFKKPTSFDYNIITIGAGSAGLVTSYIGSAVKSKVLLIEKEKMGGDCLNTGCVPSKALIKTAKVIHFQKRSKEFGLREIKMEYKFSEIMERVQRIIKEVEPHDSVDRYEKLGVACLRGDARLTSPWTVTVGGKEVSAKNIVIATGAGPVIPKIEGIETASYVTSDTIWGIRELPKKFVILGGGPIGCEMAQAFARLGSEVTIIQTGERLLAKEDSAVASLISKIFVEEEIKLLLSHKVKSFSSLNGVKYVHCEFDGKEVAVEYDLVLIAVGRAPRTKGFGLQELGIKLRENGTVDVNEYLQTSLPNIYACGDVTGPYQLTHMASHQAWYCAVNSLFPFKFKVDYSVVPWCTYTDPEVATVGETEDSAKQKGLEFELTEYHLSELDRAIAESETTGVVRVLTQKGKDKILGATIVAPQASSMILEFVSAMKNKKGLNSILGTIHVYPSFGEANKAVAGVWKKNQIKPRMMNILERYFDWQR